MRITHPRLANALHESTNIQTVLEKNDEDLIEYSFKSLRIEGIKKSNLSVQSCVFSNCSFGTCCPDYGGRCSETALGACQRYSGQRG